MEVHTPESEVLALNSLPETVFASMDDCVQRVHPKGLRNVHPQLLEGVGGADIQHTTALSCSL